MNTTITPAMSASARDSQKEGHALVQDGKPVQALEKFLWALQNDPCHEYGYLDLMNLGTSSRECKALIRGLVRDPPLPPLDPRVVTQLNLIRGEIVNTRIKMHMDHEKRRAFFQSSQTGYDRSVEWTYARHRVQGAEFTSEFFDICQLANWGITRARVLIAKDPQKDLATLRHHLTAKTLLVIEQMRQK